MDNVNNTSATGLLIDFNSPVSKRTIRPPLIPVPKPTDQISVSPTTNNPFDVVARRAFSPDPFDKAFESAFNTLNEMKQNNKSSNDNHRQFEYDTEQKVKNNKGNVVQPDNKKSVEKLHRPSKDNSVENTCDTNNTLPIQDDIINNGCKNSNISGDFSRAVNNYFPGENGVQINNETVVNNCTKSNTTNTSDKNPSIHPSFHDDCDGTSQVSNDFSTDESLKAVIAKRVNKCIQKVLNNSLKLTSSKSSDNLPKIEEEARIKKTSFNRRSLSFVTLSNNQNKCDKLNKSCTDHSLNNESFNLENQNLTPDSSMDSFNLPPMSPASNDVSKNDVFLNSENDEVFQEANKLARTFSKLAESFTKVEDNDDLMSCKPEWLYADSSEDEEEKLRKDPALNVRVSLTNSITLGEADSQALSMFKARTRRSLGHLMPVANVQDESELKRSFSIGSKPKPIVVPVIPTIQSSVPAPIVSGNVEDKPLKLKKRVGGDAKRGPMRAVMPVQCMTKESAPQQGKNMKKKEDSPIRKQQSIQIIETPCKNTSQLGIHPVASSTPNKSVYGKEMCNLPTPSIDIPSNKRRSLGSTLGSRKSRTPTAEEGARQRSSSANSGIPAPVAVVVANRSLIKPQLSVVNSASRPKSTSYLPRNNLSNSQIAKRENKTDKNTPKQVKSNYNPRALSDVKPKANRMKTTVSAISNFVVGKGKKSAAKDKENRVPV